MEGGGRGRQGAGWRVREGGREGRMKEGVGGNKYGIREYNAREVVK